MEGRTMSETQTETTERKSRRERGEGRVWQIGKIWWIQYYVHGRQVRESSKSKTKTVAERLLRRRLGELAAGVLPPPRSQRVKYEDLRAALMAEYQSNGRKCVKLGKDGEPYVCSAPHLDEFFAGYRAIDITTDRIR